MVTLGIGGYINFLVFSDLLILSLETKHVVPKSFHNLLPNIVPEKRSSKFSLRNPKNFRTCEPFKFSNARFFYPY